MAPIRGQFFQAAKDGFIFVTQSFFLGEHTAQFIKTRQHGILDFGF
jgi:hypothetical protein